MEAVTNPLHSPGLETEADRGASSRRSHQVVSTHLLKLLDPEPDPQQCRAGASMPETRRRSAECVCRRSGRGADWSAVSPLPSPPTSPRLSSGHSAGASHRPNSHHAARLHRDQRGTTALLTLLPLLNMAYTSSAPGAQASMPAGGGGTSREPWDKHTTPPPPPPNHEPSHSLCGCFASTVL